MAIYHLQVKTVSRRDGRSAVAAAAYRSGEQLRDERLGIEHDYTRKQGVIETDIMAPEGVPEWVYEREQLWNAVEAAEHRKDAKVAREYEIALPHELNPEQRSELVFDYAGWLAERHQVVVDVAIHSPHREGDQRNHHAHLLTTTREINCEGLGAKTRALDVSRTSSALIEEAREMWAEYCNDSLRRAQVLDQQIDHRSFERQGVEQTPTVHLGPEATAMERRGENSRLGDENRLIHVLNQARVLAKEQFERASEVLDRLAQRVKELGQDVSQGLSEGLRRFQSAMERERAVIQHETPQRALEGSQGPPERLQRSGQDDQDRLALLTGRFEQARDRYDEFRAERDVATGEDRRQAQQRMDWQRPALRQSFARLAGENPVKAMNVAYEEADKFFPDQDRVDHDWWREQLSALAQHPEVQADLEERARAVWGKVPVPQPKDYDIETSGEKSIDRERDRGMDIDF